MVTEISRTQLHNNNPGVVWNCPVAVVIPAYKAERTLEKVVRGLPEQVRWIVVVNDASPDQTLEAAQRCTQMDPRVVVLSHSKNQGVGGAVISGYLEAARLGAQVAVKMDADDQMDPAYLSSLVRPLVQGKADYVKGNRFIRLERIEQMPFARRVGNIGLSFLAKIASGYWNVFDPTNGYTAIKTSLLQSLDLDQIDRRYYFETNLLVELGLLRAVVRDVYIPARYQDETSSLSEWDTLKRFPAKLLRSFFRRMLLQYFLRDFSIFSILIIVGLTFSIFGLIFGMVKWIVSIQTGIPATTGTVMIAVLPLILGVQFLLQAVLIDIQNVPVEPVAPLELQKEE
jgi:glycosyltransferase involved in cell wall biosynthesis